MGECYWCGQPWCDPWGSCQERDPSDLEMSELEELI